MYFKFQSRVFRRIQKTFQHKEGEYLTMKEEEKLLELMKMFNQNRIDYNERIWSTLRFFQAIYTALIGATIVGLNSIYEEYIKCMTTISEKSKICFSPPFLFTIILCTLPVLGLIAINYCEKNIRREQKLLFFEEAQAINIANYLKLDVQFKNKEDQWLRKQKNVLSDKWRPAYNGTTYKNNLKKNLKSWVKNQIKNKEEHSFLTIFKKVFIGERIIAYVLIILIIIIACVTHILPYRRIFSYSIFQGRFFLFHGLFY